MYPRLLKKIIDRYYATKWPNQVLSNFDVLVLQLWFVSRPHCLEIFATNFVILNFSIYKSIVKFSYFLFDCYFLQWWLAHSQFIWTKILEWILDRLKKYPHTSLAKGRKEEKQVFQNSKICFFENKKFILTRESVSMPSNCVQNWNNFDSTDRANGKQKCL